jgi:hypothetical protein
MKKILKGLVIGALALNLVLAFGVSSITLVEGKPVIDGPQYYDEVQI